MIETIRKHALKIAFLSLLMIPSMLYAGNGIFVTIFEIITWLIRMIFLIAGGVYVFVSIGGLIKAHANKEGYSGPILGIIIGTIVCLSTAFTDEILKLVFSKSTTTTIDTNFLK